MGLLVINFRETKAEFTIDTLLCLQQSHQVIYGAHKIFLRLTNPSKLPRLTTSIDSS